MMSEGQQVEQKKKTVKRSRELEVVASDRISLIYAANDFVLHMVTKQINSPVSNAELSDNETRTLDAALSFLERQFKVGYRESELHEKKVEQEDLYE